MNAQAIRILEEKAKAEKKQEKMEKQQKARDILAAATKQLGWGNSSDDESDGEGKPARGKAAKSNPKTDEQKRKKRNRQVVQLNDSFSKQQFGVRESSCVR